MIRLTGNLQRETSLLQRFTAVLRDEAAALSPSPLLDSLHAISDQKIEFTKTLDALNDERNLLLAGLGFEPEYAGMEQAQAAHVELRLTWSAVLEAALAARTQNDANGVLVHERIQETRQSLDALKAMQAATSVYDARGRSQKSNARHTIVAA